MLVVLMVLSAKPGVLESQEIPVIHIPLPPKVTVPAGPPTSGLFMDEITNEELLIGPPTASLSQDERPTGISESTIILLPPFDIPTTLQSSNSLRPETPLHSGDSMSQLLKKPPKIKQPTGPDNMFSEFEPPAFQPSTQTSLPQGLLGLSLTKPPKIRQPNGEDNMFSNFGPPVPQPSTQTPLPEGLSSLNLPKPPNIKQSTGEDNLFSDFGPPVPQPSTQTSLPEGLSSLNLPKSPKIKQSTGEDKPFSHIGPPVSQPSTQTSLPGLLNFNLTKPPKIKPATGADNLASELGPSTPQPSTPTSLPQGSSSLNLPKPQETKQSTSSDNLFSDFGPPAPQPLTQIFLPHGLSSLTLPKPSNIKQSDGADNLFSDFDPPAPPPSTQTSLPQELLTSSEGLQRPNLQLTNEHGGGRPPTFPIVMVPIMPYKFNFIVSSAPSSVFTSRNEEQSATGPLVGQYSYLRPDGIYMVVRYSADENGYQAKVVESKTLPPSLQPLLPDINYTTQVPPLQPGIGTDPFSQSTSHPPPNNPIPDRLQSQQNHTMSYIPQTPAENQHLIKPHTHRSQIHPPLHHTPPLQNITLPQPNPLDPNASDHQQPEGSSIASTMSPKPLPPTPDPLYPSLTGTATLNTSRPTQAPESRSQIPPFIDVFKPGPIPLPQSPPASLLPNNPSTTPNPPTLIQSKPSTKPNPSTQAKPENPNYVVTKPPHSSHPPASSIPQTIPTAPSFDNVTPQSPPTAPQIPNLLKPRPKPPHNSDHPYALQKPPKITSNNSNFSTTKPPKPSTTTIKPINITFKPQPPEFSATPDFPPPHFPDFPDLINIKPKPQLPHILIPDIPQPPKDTPIESGNKPHIPPFPNNPQHQIPELSILLKPQTSSSTKLPNQEISNLSNISIFPPAIFPTLQETQKPQLPDSHDLNKPPLGHFPSIFISNQMQNQDQILSTTAAPSKTQTSNNPSSPNFQPPEFPSLIILSHPKPQDTQEPPSPDIAEGSSIISDLQPPQDNLPDITESPPQQSYLPPIQDSPQSSDNPTLETSPPQDSLLPSDPEVPQSTPPNISTLTATTQNPLLPSETHSHFPNFLNLSLPQINTPNIPPILGFFTTQLPNANAIGTTKPNHGEQQPGISQNALPQQPTSTTSQPDLLSITQPDFSNKITLKPQQQHEISSTTGHGAVQTQTPETPTSLKPDFPNFPIQIKPDLKPQAPSQPEHNEIQQGHEIPVITITPPLNHQENIQAPQYPASSDISHPTVPDSFLLIQLGIKPNISSQDHQESPQKPDSSTPIQSNIPLPDQEEITEMPQKPSSSDILHPAPEGSYLPPRTSNLLSTSGTEYLDLFYTDSPQDLPVTEKPEDLDLALSSIDSSPSQDGFILPLFYSG
ncbi:hypothetical protein SK128_021171 [Halocaridina rubra]|uniref:Uncharacterized protein n=1 Tax=Halocaridina rubra TaxID=373956 RepID=A0AAN8ZTJ5_HALRR